MALANHGGRDLPQFFPQPLAVAYSFHGEFPTERAVKCYRPPPAQAQAQPAQAQAQAQPPPPPKLLPLLVDLGTGLVLLVILLVKSVTLPITPLEKSCTPVTTDAANVPPGKVGSEIPPPLPPDGADVVLGTEVPRPKEGSYLGHQIGTNTGPPWKTRLVLSS